MYLRRGATSLQVRHELSHFLDFKKHGFRAYTAAGEIAREQSVWNRLRRSLKGMTRSEHDFSYEYILRKGGNPQENKMIDPIERAFGR